jgi:uncharacterized protein
MQKVEKREALVLDNQGQKIFAVLHLPLHVSFSPVVLMCGGYAGNKCSKFRLSVRLSQALAKRGIASLRFDYRGTGDSEGEFEELTLESQVSDALCCLNYLKSHTQIDANQIGILGRSLGGMIAVLTTRDFPSIKSLVLWSPVFNSEPWQTLWKAIQSNNPLDLKEVQLVKNLSPIASNPDFLDQFFQADLIPELRRLNQVPLLHIQGLCDEVVSNAHAQAYQQARSTIPCSRFVTLPHSDHAFSSLEEQQIAIEETGQWFEQTLLVKELTL